MTWVPEMLAGGRATPDDVAGLREALLFDCGNVRDKSAKTPNVATRTAGPPSPFDLTSAFRSRDTTGGYRRIQVPT